MNKTENRTKRNILTNLFYDESGKLNDMSLYLQKMVTINKKILQGKKFNSKTWQPKVKIWTLNF